jgi:hypothetical protein
MIDIARRQGTMCAVGTEIREGELVTGLRMTARTMHPAFMSGAIQKFDPERDK